MFYLDVVNLLLQFQANKHHGSN